MSTRNWIAVGLTIVSLVLIVPGLRSDALTITATIPLLKKPLFEETQSILRAIQRLVRLEELFRGRPGAAVQRDRAVHQDGAAGA